MQVQAANLKTRYAVTVSQTSVEEGVLVGVSREAVTVVYLSVSPSLIVQLSLLEVT